MTAAQPTPDLLPRSRASRRTIRGPACRPGTAFSMPPPTTASPARRRDRQSWDWSRPFYSAVTLASNFGAFLGAIGYGHGLDRARAHRSRTARRSADVRRDVHAHRSLGRVRQQVADCIHRAAFTVAARAPLNVRTASTSSSTRSSARHLVWFAQEAGITDWGPELLDIAASARRVRQPEAARAAARAVSHPHRGGVGGNRQSRRRGNGLGAHDRRVDRHRRMRASCARWCSWTTRSSVRRGWPVCPCT